MESKYDCDGAKKLLQEYIERHCDVEKNKTNDHLSKFSSEKYQVQAFGTPTVYKLVNLAGESLNPEEATFTIHGIILERDFPPIHLVGHVNRDQGRKKKIAAFIRQYVAITGLDLDLFDKTLEGLARVHRCFGDLLPDGNLERIQAVSIDGSTALACHTRYFTARRSSHFIDQQPFGPGVDPNGYLENLRGDAYIHTQDNVVQYLGKKEIESGTSYHNVNPARFQKGDIVELTASFFCVLTRSGKFKMITSLKSIILLEDKFREKARDDQAKLLQITKTTTRYPKRRLIPTDDEGVLSSKYARMDLT